MLIEIGMLKRIHNPLEVAHILPFPPCERLKNYELAPFEAFGGILHRLVLVPGYALETGEGLTALAEARVLGY